MSKPLPATYPEYFDRYIKLVPEDDLSEAFKNQSARLQTYFEDIPEERSGFSYAEGKWTLKEMLQHIIDAERIFTFRALSFARQEKQSLPGFEEDEYAAASHANKRTWESLCEEFKAARQSTLLLFDSFTDDMLDASGIGNEKPTTVLAMGFTALGHLYHHINVIEERYMVNGELGQ